MIKPFIYYHVSNKQFSYLATLNIQRENIAGVDYKDTISLFLDKPSVKDIEKLRKAGFTNYGKENDPIFIYKVNLRKYTKYITKAYLTSTAYENNFIDKYADKMDEEDYYILKNKWLQKNPTIFSDSLHVIEAGKYKYGKFSYYVDKQIAAAKKDSHFYQYYASHIPHLIIEIKVPITDIKIVETNLESASNMHSFQKAF